jgi:hypothetical protein
MKWFVVVLSVLVMAACNNEDEAVIGQYTTVEYDEVFDAGTVAKGEVVKAKIAIKNTGKYPLVIADVKGACSCTVSSFERDPIAPGELTYINAEINTDNTGKGTISKSVTMTANTRPSSTKVVIKAKVID